MHAEVLSKAYETDNGSITIPLEIHVSPNERCYEMYGQILEDNGYTEELISRARTVTVQMPEEKKRPLWFRQWKTTSIRRRCT